METVKVVNDTIKSLRIMICDDEEEHILQLQQILERLQEKICIQIESGTSPVNLLQLLKKRIDSGEALPEVIFLDIRMPGVDGLSFGKEVHRIAPDVYLIFTTAYVEYAVEGYEVQAFRYLLKPLTQNMVQKTLKEIQSDMGRKKRLVIRTADEEKVLALQDIIYLGAEDKYTVLYTMDGYYVDRTSLAEYEVLLKDCGFFRIHRKYIVNFRHHKSMGKGYVMLSKGIRLPVSRRKAAAYHTELFDGLEKELLR